MEARAVVLIVVIFLMGCVASETTMDHVVVLETNKGNIEIALDDASAPLTVENFEKYVKSGHYDGTIFHRVISNFMIQGGGFMPDGKEKSTSSPIRLEASLSNKRGTIAMARTNDPNSATSQFFINVEDNYNLDPRPGSPGYAVFGKVVEGMDVVDSIRKVLTDSRGPYDDWPVEDVIIIKAHMK